MRGDVLSKVLPLVLEELNCDPGSLAADTMFLATMLKGLSILVAF